MFFTQAELIADGTMAGRRREAFASLRCWATGCRWQVTKALNVYNKFALCRNNQYTDTTRNEIVAFVERHMAMAR